MTWLVLDRSGLAALEAALAMPVLLLLLGATTDYALMFNDRAQLAAAVSSAAGYAFIANQAHLGGTVSVSADDVRAKLLASTSLTSVSATVSGPTAYCLSTSSGSPGSVSMISGTVGTACPSGKPPGVYMIITARWTYTPTLPAFSTLSNTTISENAVVRLY